MEQAKCPICRKEVIYKYKIYDGDGKTFTEWFHCACGSMFHLKPIIKEYFNENYLSKYKNMLDVEYRFEYFFRVYAPLIEDLTYGRKFLDVGFTLPYAMKYMEKRGWISKGIDLIPNDYITGDFETYDFNEKFDLIHFGHCLESFNDITGAINKAYDLLNKDGLLVITHPNPKLLFELGIKEFGHWDWREEWLFVDKQELIKLCKVLGFKVILKRTNYGQRYVEWNDTHLILQKEDWGEE